MLMRGQPHDCKTTFAGGVNIFSAATTEPPKLSSKTREKELAASRCAAERTKKKLSTPKKVRKSRMGARAKQILAALKVRESATVVDLMSVLKTTKTNVSSTANRLADKGLVIKTKVPNPANRGSHLNVYSLPNAGDKQ